MPDRSQFSDFRIKNISPRYDRAVHIYISFSPCSILLANIVSAVAQRDQGLQNLLANRWDGNSIIIFYWSVRVLSNLSSYLLSYAALIRLYKRSGWHYVKGEERREGRWRRIHLRSLQFILLILYLPFFSFFTKLTILFHGEIAK